MLIVSLFACGQGGTEETTTKPHTTISELSSARVSATETLKSSALSLEEISALESGPFSEVLQEQMEYMQFVIEGEYYAFYDIDGNGEKECLLGLAIYGGIGINYVFTTHNGVAVQQEGLAPLERDLERARPRLLFSNGVIRTEGSDEAGNIGYGYLHFENGELKYWAGLSIQHGEYFRYNPIAKQETPITKAEFNHLQKEFEGDGQVVELDWKPLAEYGR